MIGSIVRPILGAEIEEITVPCDGMIFSLREYPAVCEGELLARICKKESTNKSENSDRCILILLEYALCIPYKLGHR